MRTIKNRKGILKCIDILSRLIRIESDDIGYKIEDMIQVVIEIHDCVEDVQHIREWYAMKYPHFSVCPDQQRIARLRVIPECIEERICQDARDIIDDCISRFCDIQYITFSEQWTTVITERETYTLHA